MAMQSSKSEPKLSTKCDCFDDDYNFFCQSFVRPKARPQIFERKDNVAFMKDPTYKPRKSYSPLKNVPFRDYFDPVHKAALTFMCYLNESDGDEGELLKIRPMKLVYHLDDDTMSLVEPRTDNSGHLQGRMFHAQRVPRSDRKVGQDSLTWRDLRVGEDVSLFGRSYRLVSCDPFTRAFYQDRGLQMSESESMPVDSWNLSRHFQTDKAREAAVKQFLRNKDVEATEEICWLNAPSHLTFLCAWLDSRNDFYGQRVKRTFKLIMDTSDDSVNMIETTPGFGNQLFLKTDKLPYETSDGTRKFYRVENMRPGMWIFVYKRPMYVFDCEGSETRAYLKQQFGEIEFGQCSIELLLAGPPPEPVENLLEELCFRATNSEFPSFRFLIVFSVNGHRIDIFEESRRRHWTKGRPFLLEIDAGPLREKDFRVGESVRIFKWTFTLTEASDSTGAFIAARETTERE